MGIGRNGKGTERSGRGTALGGRLAERHRPVLCDAQAYEVASRFVGASPTSVSTSFDVSPVLSVPLLVSVAGLCVRFSITSPFHYGTVFTYKYLMVLMVLHAQCA